ncbi:MAG: ferrochelatase [Gammaproteobacteria bacterium]
MRNFLRWILVFTLALLLGALTVEYLVTSPQRMSIYLTLSLLTLMVLAVIAARMFAGTQRAGAIVLALMAFGLGWFTMTGVVLSRADDRPMPELTREKGDPGAGHTAVVYLTHGEPPLYDPISWINQMNEFDEQGIAFVPYMARPFFFYQLRANYLRVGQSNHREKHEEMIKQLEQEYRRAGDTSTRFYLSFLDDNPRVGAAVISALNDGASQIVVAEVLVTVSSHTEEGEHQVMEIDPEAYGARLQFVGPMWDSEFLYQMFVERVEANRGDTSKDRTGVLLVAHGQPEEWDKIWPLQTEQEMLFGDHILDRLNAKGYPRENLAKAWMSFKQPKPASVVEEMHAQGIEKLLFMSYTISAAGMHSQYDIPDLVYEANVPDDFAIVDLGAWGNDPLAILALKEKIDAAATRQVVSSTKQATVEH